MDIKVSICCLTYNHSDFIRSCLDGFLNQKTNFRFEVLIHDDASTDDTQQVIKHYAIDYPEIIKPILQRENQYSKYGGGINVKYNFPRAKGKYIAMCEGDDYWLDPYKLQKQVDFMEQNPDYMFSMGRVNFLYQSSMTILPKKEFIDPAKHEFFTLGDYLKQPFSQTSTFLFRNRQLEMPDWIPKVSAGDQSLVIIMTGDEGKIKFHDDYFSVYRVNENSVMKSNFIKVLENNIQAFKYWNEYTSYKYNKLLLSRIIENYIVYFIFKPRFMRKLYKNYFVESILQFFYKGIMLFKNMGRK